MIEALLQSTIDRIFDILKRLRAEHVTARPEQQLALERRIEELEGTLGELEELLAGLDALLACCLDREEHVRDLLTKEVRLRAAHAESADEADRLRYEGQIVALRHERDGVAREQFTRVIRALDFARQRTEFMRRLHAHRLASVVIQGDSEHGLYWLSHRLRDLMGGPAKPVILRHSFRAAVVDHTLNGLLAGLKRQLRPKVPDADLTRCVIGEICRLWPQQSVVLVLDNVDLLGPAGLAALLDGLWSPLVDAAEARARPPGKTCIAAFLLVHTNAPGCPPALARQDDFPRRPLRMDLPCFDARVLEEWINAHIAGGVPPDLNDPDVLFDIVEGCSGVPCDVVDELCQRWPYDWYRQSDLQKEWFQP
ncbi:hypothetical protein [Sorangium sp. So ce1078]|uniref:hypothetical protein n=1 Tax=Sorangium sp. So ce1078 TaxID=3133329 RepID=UPI003F619FA4